MSVRAEIESAFQDVPYPGDDNITRHPGCPECAEVADYFRGRNWRGHTMQSIWSIRDCLRLLTPEAFHYFVPAFMLAVLDDLDGSDVTPECLVSAFVRPTALAEESERRRFEERFVQFTPAQKKAVAAFVRGLTRSTSIS